MVFAKSKGIRLMPENPGLEPEPTDRKIDTNGEAKSARQRVWAKHGI